MKFQPSKYQQAIYDFISEGQGNLVIDAVAGSGKTTTIVNAIELIDSSQSVLFLAFNKSIVEELKIKLEWFSNVEVSTIHSLGARSLTSTFKTKIDGDKYKAHFNRGLETGLYRPTNSEMEVEEYETYKGNIRKLIDLVRVNLCSSVDQFQDLAFQHGLFLVDNEVSIAADVVRWGYKSIETIDFTDMIYFPALKKINMPKYDWIFIDECQDLNAAQRTTVLKCLAEGGRFVAVGDPKQAIYGFAGADIESFNILKNTPNTTCLPLSVCYRCDESIIDLAKDKVPYIEARPNAPYGEVEFDAHYSKVKDGDMIICRNVAPLTSLCMHYISNGIKAYIKGGDIGTNLINMIKNTKRVYVEDAIAILNKEYNKILKRVSDAQKCTLIEAQEAPQCQTYLDKIEAIKAIANTLKTSEAVINRINTIFSDTNKSGICLSSIHKSKGLEADRVFILNRDMLYNKRAMKIDWMAEQEHNLVYVAITRAKHYLGFIEF